MIHTTNIKTLEQFEALKKGDLVAAEWRRDMYIGNDEARFGNYKVVENKKRTQEIILQTKHNVYFNYNMFLNPEREGISNLKSLILIEIK